MKNYDYLRITAVSPKVSIGDPLGNFEIAKHILEEERKTDIVLFPELSMTGYTCGDLFGQQALLKSALKYTKQLSYYVSNQVVVVGLPYSHDGKLYNCAAVLNNEQIVGIVPKQYLPTYKEFYEKRWFQPAAGIENSDIFGPNQLFKFSNEDFEEVIIGVEICEDLWMTIPPSSHHAIAGANIILNLSASNETVGKADYRTDLVKNQSGRCVCAYAYASAGPSESTSDIVMGGHSLIAENSHILAESDRVGKNYSDGDSKKEFTKITADIDIEKLNHERRNNSFGDSLKFVTNYKVVDIELLSELAAPHDLKRKINTHPFVPDDTDKLKSRCEDIFGIQTWGLQKRLEQLPDTLPLVIGVSGGLDSTLALLVAIKACNRMKGNSNNIQGITMPGFGTTNRTKNNALDLMKKLNIKSETIDIRPMSLQMFNDINYRPFDIGVDCVGRANKPFTMEELEAGLKELEPGWQDLVFENVQARVRTLTLMSKGFVLGTGDLSELALGWCTYNGDHMSMYNVNCSIPKTLVKFLVKYVAENDKTFANVRDILLDIVDTEISPELLPAKDGKIVQSTEDHLGPYELHDFFLSHFIRDGFSPRKIVWLAEQAFSKKYDRGFIVKTIITFYQKFFKNQFKRNCVPDGPKVGTVSLSPRGDWRMPSDATELLWTEEFL